MAYGHINEVCTPKCIHHLNRYLFWSDLPKIPKSFDLGCFFATIYSVRMKREVNVVREAAFVSDVRFARE